MTRFVSSDEAVSLISDSMNVGISAFGGWLGADELYSALESRFEREGHPKDLRVYGGILPGDLSERPVGMNLLTADGLISRVFAAHVGMAPLFGRMIKENRVAAFTPPLGVFSHLLRASAGKKPGVLSQIGIGTFCDPRLEGCRANEAAAETGEEPVELVGFDGSRCLFYKSFRLDACLLRATSADEDGNLSAE
jgi:propionate CoA-transferase